MRDAGKYRYVTIGIPLHSEELAHLEQEAGGYDVSLAKWVSMLLIDRDMALSGKGQGIWFPRGYQVSRLPAPSSSREEEQEVRLTDTVKMRAVAAATAWDEDETYD